MTIPLETLNGATQAAFVDALEGIFERAPWVAERTAPIHSFPTVAALHDALMATVEAASPAEILAFLNAHPELAASALPPDLTADSTAEQVGLSMAAAAGAADLPALNRAYRERFGFPFIIAVARHTPENILRTLTARLAADPAHERATALSEIRHITRLRLVARVSGPGLPATTGHLSTHVLDTALGRPAAGLSVALQQEGAHDRHRRDRYGGPHGRPAIVRAAATGQSYAPVRDRSLFRGAGSKRPSTPASRFRFS